MLALRSAEWGLRVHRPLLACFWWTGKSVWIGVHGSEGRGTKMKRVAFVVLATMFVLSLWVLLVLLGLPLFPCFLWPDFVIYCSEGRLYMS